jgi:threonine dehydratase
MDEMRLVSDEQMLRAISRLLLEEHVLAEPAGAAVTAAFLATGTFFAGKSVVLLVTDANIAPEVLRRALSA